MSQTQLEPCFVCVQKVFNEKLCCPNEVFMYNFAEVSCWENKFYEGVEVGFDTGDGPNDCLAKCKLTSDCHFVVYDQITEKCLFLRDCVKTVRSVIIL